MSAATASPSTTAAPAITREKAVGPRSVALDTFRGLVMLLLVSEGFGFAHVRGVPWAERIAAQLDHVPWTGGVLWDMIQPAFMFMVGVAMPFAMARRLQLGESRREIGWHVAIRALRLILLSQVLMIVSDGRISFQLINVLSQIAFTYFFTYLILQLPLRYQVVAAAGILGFHELLFAVFPGPNGAWSQVGNIGQRFDQWWLGRTYSGFYVTLNFVSSTVTTLAGAWAGLLMRSDRAPREKIAFLLGGSALGFAAGVALSPWIPLVKRLWTPSWALYSLGWVILALAALYYIVDMRGVKKWTFPFVIFGMNSIFIYSVANVGKSWIDHAVGAFTQDYKWAGALAPVYQYCTVLLVMWGLCYWLYKRRIFFKL